jgi:hypothetical protein
LRQTFLGGKKVIPIPKGTLPDGNWITFWRVPARTTAEDIQSVIRNRTGLEIELDRILVRWESNSALVSLTKKHVREILQWALTDDLLNGASIDCGEQPRRVTVAG